MRTIVTGATGLVGNAIARRLVDDGHEVAVLVRRPDAARPLLPDGVEVIVGDIGDAARLAQAFAGRDFVFHAAGLPEQWQRDPSVFDHVNRQGTANVCDASLAAGVTRLVHTSTMDVFRKGPDGKLREDAPDPDPKPTAYERSKVAAEREVDARIARGLDVVVVNPGSVYGPTPTRTGLTELFVRVLERRAPMVAPGGFSVAYVHTLASAHVAAAERGRTGERYLVADQFVTVRALAAEIADAAGLPKAPRAAPAWVLRSIAVASQPLARVFGFRPLLTPGELRFLLWSADVDTTKARTELGFEPMPLRAGVRRTVEHLRASGVGAGH